MSLHSLFIDHFFLLSSKGKKLKVWPFPHFFKLYWCYYPHPREIHCLRCAEFFVIAYLNYNHILNLILVAFRLVKVVITSYVLQCLSPCKSPTCRMFWARAQTESHPNNFFTCFHCVLAWICCWVLLILRCQRGGDYYLRQCVKRMA